MDNNTKILFLLKKGTGYGGYGTYSPLPKSGLLNSAGMTASKLSKEGVQTEIKVCIDGNSINKELHDYKPTICILEAIWVTPDKLRELVTLHPSVQFIIRVHSELPFLANEGNAIEWLKEYSTIKNVFIALNSSKTYRDFKSIVKSNLLYLPNLYEGDKPYIKGIPKFKKIVNIGCFGAIRPLKNQLIQAVAAIKFAEQHNLKLRFHINSSRVEQGGNSTLKNLRSLFKNTEHTLVEHEWMERDEFLSLVSTMDICMQVSFTESFNIVAADSVSQGVPIVVSSAISWMSDLAKAYPNSTVDMVNVLNNIKRFYIIHLVNNAYHLNLYNRGALREWKKNLK